MPTSSLKIGSQRNCYHKSDSTLHHLPFVGRLPLIPTGYRAEFESRAEKLLNWLDTQIDSLELVTMKASDEQRKTKAPKTSQPSGTLNEVIARVDKELPDAKENMVVVNSLGERYRRDLSQGESSLSSLSSHTVDLAPYWGVDLYFSR